MTHDQPEPSQTMEVRVSRLPGLKLAPEDFARRLLALCTSFGVGARLDETGTGVELEPGVEGPEAEMLDDLVAVLATRFEL